MGYVTFTASGGFSERFLNLCQKNKIILWDIKSKRGVIYANTTAKNYKKIRGSARRSSMKVRIYKKHGMPFIAHRHRNRVGFLVGFVMFLAIISILSTRLWTIDVKGNKNVSDKQILQVFNKFGVEVGAKISDIDVKKVQDLALTELEDLSWLAINMNGSTATIEVKESIKKPKLAKKTPCNIVASYGGQIIKMEVYQGTRQQELGNAVAKGDLLISGVVEHIDKTSDLKHANGLIVANTERDISSTQSKEIKNKMIVKEKTRYRILFFGLDIPLLWLSQEDSKNSSYFCHKHMLKSGKTILPVGFVKEGYKIYEDRKITLRDNNCQLLSFEKYRKLQEKNIGDSKILTEDINIKNTDNTCEIIGKYKCEENICSEQEIYVEDKITN